MTCYLATCFYVVNMCLTTMCTTLSPGLALRGDSPDEIHQAVDGLNREVPFHYVVLVVGSFFFYLSLLFFVWMEFPQHIAVWVTFALAAMAVLTAVNQVTPLLTPC